MRMIIAIQTDNKQDNSFDHLLNLIMTSPDNKRWVCLMVNYIVRNKVNNYQMVNELVDGTNVIIILAVTPTIY